MEFVALTCLAFAAAFRGWGFWPFLLLALPFVPALDGGTLEFGTGVLFSSLSSVFMLTAVSGLGLMILVGRET
ncbi:MAG: hypothetical protein ABFS46_21080 [Myxococcota bacterium]